MNLSKLIEQYCEENKIHRFEGTTGVNNLQKILGVLGYKEGNYFGYNNEIINFLSDNPGAIEAILNWIGEINSLEWKENIISGLREKVVKEDEN